MMVTRFLIVVSALCGASGAFAQATGIVIGEAFVADTRLSPYQMVGITGDVAHAARQVSSDGCDPNILSQANICKFDGLGQGTPALEMEVRVYVYQTSSVYTIFYGRVHDGEGYFHVSWNSTFTPIKIKVALVAARPNTTETTVSTTAPPLSWSIENAGVVVTSTTLTSDFTGVKILSFDLSDVSSEAVNNYLTAYEVYQMWDANGAPTVGGSIRGDAQGVEIDISGDVSGGFTPTDHLIEIETGFSNQPWLLAHEFGHLLVWRGLDIPYPILQPQNGDYECIFPGHLDGNPSWEDTGFECDKAAFHEGFAEAHSALWMWQRTAPTVLFPGDPSAGVFNMETTGSCSAGHDHAWNEVVCNARAVWDVLDAPSDGDDDGLTTFDLSDVVSTLRSYQRGCFPCDQFHLFNNHCAVEGYMWSCGEAPDLDGNNWNDFAFNFSAVFAHSAQINAIGTTNSVMLQQL